MNNMYVADLLFMDAFSVQAVRNWLNRLRIAASSMSIGVSVPVVFSASETVSPHIWQKRKPSSFSAWHVGHRTLARDADTFTSERNGIDSPASRHEASSLPTMLRTIVRAVEIVRRA